MSSIERLAVLVAASFIASLSALAEVYPVGAAVVFVAAVLILGCYALPWDRTTRPPV